MANNDLLKEEIDYTALRREPSKLMGYVYVYFLAGLVFLGLVYVWNLTPTGKNAVTPAVLGDSTAFVRDIPYQSPRNIPPVDVMTVATPTPELVERGRDLYQGNCSSCHGTNGEGDGPSGLTLNPKPRNFHAGEGWVNGRKVSDIYRTLEEGIVKTGMASFNYLAPSDRFALAHYVRTFMQNPPKDTREDLEMLEATYQLSKGTSTAGTIPVRRATRILEREEARAIQETGRALALLEQEGESPAAAVLRRCMTDRRRALYSLVVSELPSRSVNEFVTLVCSDPQSLGLRPEIAQLSSEEWSQLYRLVQQLKSQLAQDDRRRG